MEEVCIHFLISDLNSIKTSMNESKSAVSTMLSISSLEPSVVLVWPSSGNRRPSWEVEELRWCDGPDHRPNAGAWAGVVKAETEIKTNGVS